MGFAFAGCQIVLGPSKEAYRLFTEMWRAASNLPELVLPLVCVDAQFVNRSPGKQVERLDSL
jgi:hypothetical protein